jgi:multiple sugar transport system permease protein
MQDPWFWNSLKNISVFTATSVILHLLVGLVFALLLNERWFSIPLRNFMRGVLILPWVFSTAASGLMWSLLYHPFGLLNYFVVGILGQPKPIEFLSTPAMAMASIIAVNTWKSYPFYMIIILGGLQVIPPELYEAAKVDGASAWQRFRYITLPQLRPVLIAISIIDIITTAGHVDLIKILTRGGPLRSTETVAYYIYNVALLDGNLGYGAAISTLMLIMLTILIVIYLKIVSRGGQTGETSF